MVAESPPIVRPQPLKPLPLKRQASTAPLREISETTAECIAAGSPPTTTSSGLGGMHMIADGRPTAEGQLSAVERVDDMSRTWTLVEHDPDLLPILRDVRGKIVAYAEQSAKKQPQVNSFDWTRHDYTSP